MNRIWKPLKGAITERFGWKVLSLLIAFIIWGLVASEPELSTFTTVRLEYKNLPDGLEISSDPVTSVVLELHGPSGALRGLGETLRPSVVLDMSNAKPGEHTYPIGDGNVKLARGLRLIRAIPSEVRFHFEPRRNRIVPVEARFAGEGQNGYQVARVEIDPKQVTVMGPSSHVARAGSAITDRIDVSSLIHEAEFRVNMFVEDPYVRLQGPPEATVRVTMKKK